MRLFIAEKPIQGQAIADALLPPDQQQRGEYSIICKDDVITWAEGHLYEQVPPQYYDQKFQVWRLKDLPIIPSKWIVLPIKHKQNQIKSIHALIGKADVIVHACDPDREGQLIGDEILAKGPNTPAVRKALRLWPQGLDPASLQQALSEMQPNSTYRNFTLAALARSRADWLIGMNLSRKCTMEAKGVGYGLKFPIGRVKTPTLALVVQRDAEIDSFVPQPYIVVGATFRHRNGLIETIWEPTIGTDTNGYLVDHLASEAVVAKIKGQPGNVKFFTESPEQVPPPLPVDLTALISQANRKAGLTARQTMAAAQSLYEHYRVISYPRTSCRYLNETEYKNAAVVLLAIAKNDTTKSALCQAADLSLKSAAWDTAKGGASNAHTAIVPTTNIVNLSAMSGHEQVVYDLICSSYLAQFYPVAEFSNTSILITCAEETFHCRQRDELTPGWRVLYPSKKKTAKKPPLPRVEFGDHVECLEAQVNDKLTEPPQHFNDGTLIEAMKNIHKFMTGTSEKQKERLAGMGIGTEATRDGIIETLISRDGFLTRDGISIVSTRTGREEISAISAYDQLIKPNTTAENEEKLERIQRGIGSVEEFMQDQEQLVTGLVRSIKIPRNPDFNAPPPEPQPPNAERIQP